MILRFNTLVSTQERKKTKMIKITRDGNGISLNAGIRDTLLDKQGNIIKFKNIEYAKKFLRQNKYDPNDPMFRYELC